jgi:hypothetical protein
MAKWENSFDEEKARAFGQTPAYSLKSSLKEQKLASDL